LDRLGLDAAELNRLNEQLVVISLSATGRGSAIESLRSYGLMLSALGGYESLITDQNDAFIGSPTFVMSDPNAALFGVYAALAGALHARETGVGATYECSQVEAVVSLVDAPSYDAGTAAMLDGMFATADGEFVAVTLAATSPSAGFPTEVAAFKEWAAQNSYDDVAHQVQGAGGTVTKVSSLADTETSDVFKGMDVRQSIVHPISGERELVATPWLFDGKRPALRSPAPLLGGDTEDVLRRVLGYDEDKIAAVHEAGVIDEPIAAE